MSYYLQQVDALFLTEPDHIKRFQTNVFNILDHALDRQDGRLGEIKKVIKQLLDEKFPSSSGGGSSSSSGLKRGLATQSEHDGENVASDTIITTAIATTNLQPPSQKRRNETGGQEEEGG